ncbi:coA-transferase III family protein [Mycobacterium avium subsp. avium 2285 (R)]|nr:coA-transferase III family protein [Mycobacterium avium subsp. avium 2285 (R)]
MNHGKLCYGIDFDRDADQLRELLTVSDIVIEGSRPAALRRRGLGPADIAPRPGRIWLQITAFDDDRPGFGDDAAVGGGLVGTSAAGPVFCGDAIADPLTGLHAALAVAESLGRGGGELIRLSMAGVAAGYAALGTEPPTSDAPVSPPAPRRRRGRPPRWAPTTPPCVTWSAKGVAGHADSAGHAAGRDGGRHPGGRADRGGGARG